MSHQRRLLPFFLVLFAALVLATTVGAQIVVDEEFTHDLPPRGVSIFLVGQTPTPGPGAVWAAHSGAGNKAIEVSGGQITLVQSSGSGEDVNTGFAAMGAGDKLYAGFDLTLPPGQTVDPDASGLYFAHFRAGFNFMARVFVVAPGGGPPPPRGPGGDYGLALDANGSTPSVTWPANLNFDQTYRIVVSYDFDTGNTQLWVDAVMEGDPSIVDNVGTPSTAIDSFAFRQSNDYTGSQTIDNLVVSDSFNISVPVELMSFSID